MIRVVRSITLIAVLAAVCAALLTGCGNNQASAPMPSPSATTSSPKVAASGPAISTTLTFDQLALETPAKKTKNKNGLVFLQFSYADNDGKIYKCELPEAMSKGSYSPQEWVRTFNIYRLPKVIGQKKIKKGGPVVIGDFPFISPRPKQVETTKKPTATPMPMMPNLPPMPSQPTQPQGPPPVTPPASARPMPGGRPGP